MAASPVLLRATASDDVCVDGGLHRDEGIASGASGDDVCDRGATAVLGDRLPFVLLQLQVIGFEAYLELRRGVESRL
jgi:hypothetical protein